MHTRSNAQNALCAKDLSIYKVINFSSTNKVTSKGTIFRNLNLSINFNLDQILQIDYS